MTRLFWKLFLTLWLTVIVFAVTIGLISDSLARKAARDADNTRWRPEISQVSRKVATVLRTEGETAARNIIAALPNMVRNHVYLVDNHNNEILGRERLLKKLRARRVQTRTHAVNSASGKTFQLIQVRRIPPQAILATGPQGTLLRLLAAALISAVVSFFLARYLTSPLERLRKASRQLAEGDLSTRVGGELVERKDEIGALAADFDTMAAQLQKMQQANRRLLRDVSHELRSPLARLRVALELARNKDSNTLQAELDRIELEGERLDELVGEVLRLLRETSDSSPLQKEPVNLVALLADLQDDVNFETAAEDCRVTMQAPEQLELMANRELLLRAFENLLRNASRYTDPSKGVEVTITERSEHNDCVILIRDYGEGVPATELDKIFEPFYRVHEARDRHTGGHGLGLAIAKAAIQRHGGEIKAENVDRQGLLITVTLPLPA